LKQSKIEFIFYDDISTSSRRLIGYFPHISHIEGIVFCNLSRENLLKIIKTQNHEIKQHPKLATDLLYAYIIVADILSRARVRQVMNSTRIKAFKTILEPGRLPFNKFSSFYTITKQEPFMYIYCILPPL